MSALGIVLVVILILVLLGGVGPHYVRGAVGAGLRLRDRRHRALGDPPDRRPDPGADGEPLMTVSAKVRASLPASKLGRPKSGGYPMNDKKHAGLAKAFAAMHHAPDEAEIDAKAEPHPRQEARRVHPAKQLQAAAPRQAGTKRMRAITRTLGPNAAGLASGMIRLDEWAERAARRPGGCRGRFG